MRHRGLRGNVTRGTRVMAGLRSRALGPGARSWLTSVAGPRFESAARTSIERRMWSAGRRLVPSPGRGDASQASHRMVSPAIHRGSRTPPRLPALRSPRGSRKFQFAVRRTRRRSKNTGDESWLRCLTTESWRRKRGHTFCRHTPRRRGIQRVLVSANVTRWIVRRGLSSSRALRGPVGGR